MTKKKTTKKKANKVYILWDEYGGEVYGRAFASMKAAEKWITDEACEGRLNEYLVTEKIATVKVNIKVEALNKKEKKVK